MECAGHGDGSGNGVSHRRHDARLRPRGNERGRRGPRRPQTVWQQAPPEGSRSRRAQRTSRRVRARREIRSPATDWGTDVRGRRRDHTGARHRRQRCRVCRRQVGAARRAAVYGRRSAGARVWRRARATTARTVERWHDQRHQGPPAVARESLRVHGLRHRRGIRKRSWSTGGAHGVGRAQFFRHPRCLCRARTRLPP